MLVGSESQQQLLLLLRVVVVEAVGEEAASIVGGGTSRPSSAGSRGRCRCRSVHSAQNLRHRIRVERVVRRVGRRDAGTHRRKRGAIRNAVVVGVIAVVAVVMTVTVVAMIVAVTVIVVFVAVTVVCFNYLRFAACRVKRSIFKRRVVTEGNGGEPTVSLGQ